MTLAFLAPFSPHLIYFKSSASLTTAIYQRAGSQLECACVSPQHLQCYVGSQTCRLVWRTGHHTSPSVLQLHVASVSPPLSFNTFASSGLKTQLDQNRKCTKSTYAEANKGESHEGIELTKKIPATLFWSWIDHIASMNYVFHYVFRQQATTVVINTDFTYLSCSKNPV